MVLGYGYVLCIKKCIQKYKGIGFPGVILKVCSNRICGEEGKRDLPLLLSLGCFSKQRHMLAKKSLPLIWVIQHKPLGCWPMHTMYIHENVGIIII